MEKARTKAGGHGVVRIAPNAVFAAVLMLAGDHAVGANKEEAARFEVVG